MAIHSSQVQTQTQQQVQTLSPQQILAVKLLELPTVELEERVHAELLDNPALEEGKEPSEDGLHDDEGGRLCHRPGRRAEYRLRGGPLAGRLPHRRRHTRLQAAGEQPLERRQARRHPFLGQRLFLRNPERTA